jgi:TctA family transporter
MEEHFRRAMLMSRGSFSTFIDRPISATVLAVTAALLVWGTWSAYRRRNQRVLAAQTHSS